MFYITNARKQTKIVQMTPPPMQHPPPTTTTTPKSSPLLYSTPIAFNFPTTPSVTSVSVSPHPSHPNIPPPHAPNPPNNSQPYPPPPANLSDTHICTLHLPVLGCPSCPSFGRGLRVRRLDGGVVFSGRWRDSVGCRCVGSQCRGSSGFGRGRGGFLLLTSELVRRPTKYISTRKRRARVSGGVVLAQPKIHHCDPSY